MLLVVTNAGILDSLVSNLATAMFSFAKMCCLGLVSELDSSSGLHSAASIVPKA